MANYTDLMSLFDDIGDAINDKGVSGQFYPNQMATAIRSIPDFTPSGNFAITANGIYDVTDYATASVNITTGIDHGVFITEEDDPAGGKIMYVTGVDLSQDTVDAAHLVSGYTAHDRSGNAIIGTFGGIELNNQAKSITPSTSQQIVSPDSGYTGLSSVTVAAIPSQYKNTSDADAVAANILYDKIAYNSTGKITGTMPNNGATGGTISTQNGTYTIPAGYTSGGTVTATLPTQTLPTSAAASATSGYTSKATISRSTSDQYINIPTGYNSAGAYYKINAVANGSVSNPTIIQGTVTNHSITLTPKVSSSAGYINGNDNQTGTAVTISAANLVSGTKSITANGTNIDVTNYASVDVAVPATSPNLQSKTNISPTTSSQTIRADSGYDGLDSVQINAMTTMTLPTTASSSATSGYSSKATISRSTSDQYINIPTGYNSAGGYYKINAVANGSATGPSSVSGTSASVSTGTNTLTLTKTGVSTTPTVSAGYVSSATASTATVTLTASVTTKAAATITPSTTNQTIASGIYLTGTQTIVGDTNLVSSNIISGKSIFGVNGSVVINKYYTGNSAPSSSLGNNGDIYFQS